MTTGQQLAVIPEGTYALLKRDPQIIMDTLREVVGSTDPTVRDLDRIKVPTGGSVNWTIPGPSGDEEDKTYRAVILAWKHNRVFWERPMGENVGSAAPDCYSDDGVMGIGTPGGSCELCPLSKFGPNNERPRCSDVRVLLTLRPDTYLPEVLMVPPASLKSCREYFLGKIAKYGFSLSGVETVFTLVKEKNAAGIVYSRIAFGIGAQLEPAEATAMYAMAQQLKPLFNRVRVDVQDVYGSDASPSSSSAAGGAAPDDFDDEP